MNDPFSVKLCFTITKTTGHNVNDHILCVISKM